MRAVSVSVIVGGALLARVGIAVHKVVTGQQFAHKDRMREIDTCIQHRHPHPGPAC